MLQCSTFKSYALNRASRARTGQAEAVVGWATATCGACQGGRAAAATALARRTLVGVGCADPSSTQRGTQESSETAGASVNRCDPRLGGSAHAGRCDGGHG